MLFLVDCSRVFYVKFRVKLLIMNVDDIFCYIDSLWDVLYVVVVINKLLCKDFLMDGGKVVELFWLVLDSLF